MPIPDGLIVLTFDDGVKSQFTFAAPLLKSLGFEATFYITEGLNFLTDKSRYMTWDEVAELDKMGFEIGNHTRAHASVAKQTPDELRSDIDHIDRRCEEYGITRPVTFCYPGYVHTPEAVAVNRERGFTFARRGTAPEFSYDSEGGRGPAYDPSSHDPLLVPTTGASGPHWGMDDFKWALDQARDGRATVLTFHGVPDLDHPWVHTDPNVFEGYVRHLHDNGYQVVSISGCSTHLEGADRTGGSRSPGRRPSSG